MPTSFAQPLTISLPDGRRLGLTRYGSPAHPAVIFHHGYASSGLSVPACAALLAELQLQILAPDRPGVGQSGVDEDMTLASSAADVVFACEALAVPGRLGVAGWSAGGLHGLALAALYPARVASLQLLSTILPFGDPAAYQDFTVGWKAVRYANEYLPTLGKLAFAEISEKWHAEPEKTIDEFLKLIFGPPEQVVGFEPHNRALLRDAAVQGFANDGQGVYFDSRAICQPLPFSLAAIQAPTTLWHGDADTIWPPESLHYLTERVPQARVKMLPGEGHMLYLKHWEEILRQVREDMK
ncbi:Pimeloyl-ACP methyl ester carboxylesterase [Hymenobacter daecheongensis DSM 21074]|uniref:Pimeloyl-ACP methyl ester carboxylesterase n=1 Tax=Hymenobacter daecheongensis DSM 21074 TaxID=1121955 RepID=A0A1M6ESF2_9BACT|nr:alpha/beta hydrolase [Hymenobacter daecheongensis]SHI88382.1 Pimeloyl-ACP methyl ester carboxylesterase [Hymenobacter daecheongensis DSM 21074]